MSKRKTLPLPEGFSAEDIKVESSVCTGEKTIGFFSKSERKLVQAELVQSERDIEEFYAKYGLKKL